MGPSTSRQICCRMSRILEGCDDGERTSTFGFFSAVSIAVPLSKERKNFSMPEHCLMRVSCCCAVDSRLWDPVASSSSGICAKKGCSRARRADGLARGEYWRRSPSSSSAASGVVLDGTWAARRGEHTKAAPLLRRALRAAESAIPSSIPFVASAPAPALSSSVDAAMADSASSATTQGAAKRTNEAVEEGRPSSQRAAPSSPPPPLSSPPPPQPARP